MWGGDGAAVAVLRLERAACWRLPRTPGPAAPAARARGRGSEPQTAVALGTRAACCSGTDVARGRKTSRVTARGRGGRPASRAGAAPGRSALGPQRRFRVGPVGRPVGWLLVGWNTMHLRIGGGSDWTKCGRRDLPRLSARGVLPPPRRPQAAPHAARLPRVRRGGPFLTVHFFRAVFCRSSDVPASERWRLVILPSRRVSPLSD